MSRLKRIFESDYELQETLSYLIENEYVLAENEIPSEWEPFIDEFYGRDGNLYYTPTKRVYEGRLLTDDVIKRTFDARKAQGVGTNFTNKKHLSTMNTFAGHKKWRDSKAKVSEGLKAAIKGATAGTFGKIESPGGLYAGNKSSRAKDAQEKRDRRKAKKDGYTILDYDRG